MCRCGARLVHLDRAAVAPVRHERERPGELLHVEVKKPGKGSTEYLKITMTELMVTSVSTGGSGGEDKGEAVASHAA